VPVWKNIKVGKEEKYEKEKKLRRNNLRGTKGAWKEEREEN
jgi:hypothetical protein